MNKDEILPIGKVTGVHGIKGEIKVAVYGGLESLSFETVFINLKGVQAEQKVKRMRPHKGSLLLELEGISTRNDAEGLVGLEISVKKSELPEPGEDEYYYFDLIGMEVLTDEGKLLGNITNIIQTGGNDVLEVEGPLGEVLIPAIEDTIIDVDMDERKVTVRLMEGLLPGEQ